jgi:predicted RND superfamily exporter protein
MGEFVAAWSTLVVRYRTRVVVASLLLLLLSLAPLGRLHFDNSTRMWFAEDDPALLDYERSRSLFGSQEFLLVGIEAGDQDPDLFNDDAFRLLYRIHGFFAGHAYVSGVRSLIDYRYLKRRGELNYITRLVPESYQALVGDEHALEEARAVVASDDFVHGRLVSADLRHTLILVQTGEGSESRSHHVPLVRDFRRFIQDEGIDQSRFKLHLGGHVAGNEAFQSAIVADQRLSFPLMLLAIASLLYRVFRGVHGVVLPLAVILGSVIASVGLLTALGWPVNMLNASLAIILMAVGIGDSIHVMTAFHQARAGGADSSEAATLAIRQTFMPCLNTTLTTMLGFLAISFSQLTPMREFGMIAACGVGLAFILSMTLLPALLSRTRGGSGRSLAIARDNPVAVLLVRLLSLTRKRRKGIMASFLVVALVSLVGASQVGLDAGGFQFLKEGSPLARDMRYFADHYGGGTSLEIVVDVDNPELLHDSAWLAKVLEAQDWLEAQPEGGETFSFVDALSFLHKALRPEEWRRQPFPEEAGRLKAYITFFRHMDMGGNFAGLTFASGGHFQIAQQISFSSSRARLDYAERAREQLERMLPRAKVRVTGVPVLFAHLNRHINRGVVQAILLNILMVGGCLLLVLGSVKYGLLAMLPSLLPLLMAAGVMGFSGMSVNIGTMLIIAITVGVAVDNAIHIVSRYVENHERQGLNPEEAMAAAIRSTGQALTYTGMVLFIGFSLLLTSSFVPNIQLDGAAIAESNSVATVILFCTTRFPGARVYRETCTGEYPNDCHRASSPQTPLRTNASRPEAPEQGPEDPAGLRPSGAPRC